MKRTLFTLVLMFTLNSIPYISNTEGVNEDAIVVMSIFFEGQIRYSRQIWRSIGHNH